MSGPASGNMTVRMWNNKQHRKLRSWKNRYKAHALQQVVWATEVTRRLRRQNDGRLALP